MEDRGILVDVSHLNDTGYADLFETARRPFVATHSNARAICSHKRNLTDDMIREMVRRNCLIGLNYCKSFITDGGIGDSPDDLYRHIEHFFSLGAYENIALGSDFDGAALPTYLNTPAKAADLYEYFLERECQRSWQRASCSGTQKNFSEKSVICIRLPANAHHRHVNAFV
ncbi:MAG: dipeptidase [Clostridium fessum]